jgi:hypothetical protein
LRGKPPFGQANPAALDAQISPGPGRHPFEVSAAEETFWIGLEPTEEIDGTTEALLARFNAIRDAGTDLATVGPLVKSLRSHYAVSSGRCGN